MCNGRALDAKASGVLAGVLKRRIAGEPLAYILGKTEFMGLEFNVNASTLIPRQETEILVETLIRLSGAMFDERQGGLRILDIGTGTGCIAVSLAHALASARIDALDGCEGALAIARGNALRHNVKINFLLQDIFSRSALFGERYDIIVSNPPYVAEEEFFSLQIEIHREPRMALDGGKDGLKFFRRITEIAKAHLNTHGMLAFEMGYNQKAAVENIIQKSGNFEIIEVAKDYAGIDRVMVARKTR